jgi:quinol monooxygenase YgiN
MHWPEPLTTEPIAHDRGPVIVTISYQIKFENRPAFLWTLHQLAEERRRDGAYAWGVTEDAEDPEQLVEWFFVESWAEHLRQHRRVSKADADIQAAARAFHHGSEAPRVKHLLALHVPRTKSGPVGRKGGP